MRRCCSTVGWACTSWPPGAGTIRRFCCAFYAKRTRKADESAAAVIGALSQAVLRS